MKKRRTAQAAPFDAEYYAKWYADPERRGIAERALRFVLSYIDHMDTEIESVSEVPKEPDQTQARM